jgi:hypothetical protein
MIAARHSAGDDVFSMSEGIKPIDQRKNFEELPARSVTPDLFLDWRPIENLKNNAKKILLVHAGECKYGILVQVVIWPANQHPSNMEMREAWNSTTKFREKLVKVFFPDVFANCMLVAVYAVDRLMQVLPIFLEGPWVEEPDGSRRGVPFKFRPPTMGQK